MFLSAKDLAELTGSQRRSKQIEWLKANGWRHVLNLRGLPIVARAEMERQLVSSGKHAAPSKIHWDRVA